MSTTSQPASSAWAGWVVFAGAVLLVIGCFNAIQGLVALFKDQVYVVPGANLVISTDFTAWGIALLIWGGVMILAGVGLHSGAEWARWFAIVVVIVNLVGQFAWFNAFPLWSLIIIALDTAVLFALPRGGARPSRSFGRSRRRIVRHAKGDEPPLACRGATAWSTPANPNRPERHPAARSRWVWSPWSDPRG
ncbi:MAG: DUF7144 family membrane protein [Miltoncostaeaceae bacterium]